MRKFATFHPQLWCKGKVFFLICKTFHNFFFKKNKTFFQVTENQALARIDETKIFSTFLALFANILKISTLDNFTKYICIVRVCM